MTKRRGGVLSSNFEFIRHIRAAFDQTWELGLTSTIGRTSAELGLISVKVGLISAKLGHSCSKVTWRAFNIRTSGVPPRCVNHQRRTTKEAKRAQTSPPIRQGLWRQSPADAQQFFLSATYACSPLSSCSVFARHTMRIICASRAACIDNLASSSAPGRKRYQCARIPQPLLPSLERPERTVSSCR